jgi:chromosome segregation ATPase
MSSILERIKGMEDTLAKLVESDKQVHNEMGKAEDEMEDKKEEVEKCNTPVLKAEEVVVPDELTIVKAKLSEYETVVKAFGDKFTELEARIKKIEDEPIHKGDVVIIGDEVKKANPMLKSVEALYKR